MATFTPIEDILVNMPNTAYGLNIAWASNTTFTVSTGVIRDSLNIREITISSAKTINAAYTGLDGLDTGALAASKQYAVFVIGDSSGAKASGCLISLSATLPTLPTGYDVFRRIGWIFTDGSSHFLLAYQTGAGLVREYQYDAAASVLSGGTSATFAAVDLSAFVPAASIIPVTLNASFTPNAAGDTCALRPTGSSDATGLILSGPTAAKVSAYIVRTFAKLSSSVAKVDYLVTASGALTLKVIGFTDYL
jgi:hypothetical protein